jgi:hypothetical protein
LSADDDEEVKDVVKRLPPDSSFANLSGVKNATVSKLFAVSVAVDVVATEKSVPRACVRHQGAQILFDKNGRHNAY